MLLMLLLLLLLQSPEMRFTHASAAASLSVAKKPDCAVCLYRAEKAVSTARMTRKARPDQTDPDPWHYPDALNAQPTTHRQRPIEIHNPGKRVNQKEKDSQ